jgi:glutathione S-transferase
MTHRLVTIPFSHFCEKARWSLDAAGVSYLEEGHCPVLHRFGVRRAGGRHSVPVLVTEGGEVLAESSLIVRFADERAPEGRKLLPAQGRARSEALALEQRFDLELGPHVRRFIYFHLLPRRADTLRLFGLRTPPVEHLAARALFPLLRRTMKRFMHIDESTALDSRDRTRRVFDEVGALLADGRPYLTGDRFSTADLTFAALAAPLIQPAEHPVTGAAPAQGPLPEALAAEVRAMREAPAGRFAARLYREHRRQHITPHVH